MTQLQYEMVSSIGPLYLVTSARGLQGVFWKRRDVPTVRRLSGHSPEALMMKRAVREISEYLGGKRRVFEIPLDVRGTEFQKKVWAELRHIPYGETRSYRDVARRIGTKGVRAVGSANGRNPLSLVIPCHRVIATGGGLGGYAGGLKIKRHLLALEAVEQN